jgi:uncharacterized protein (TIGR03000 family)
MLKRSLLAIAPLALATAGLLWTPDMTQAQWRGRAWSGARARGWDGGRGWGGYYGGWGGWGGQGLGLDSSYYGYRYGSPYYGRGFYRRGYGYDYGGYYPGQMIVTSPPAYGDYATAPMTGYESAYPSGAAATSNAAVVRVEVPDANAEVWFNGSKTRQKGTMREFESPPLEPGQDYTYKVRAHWTQDGRDFDQERTVHVQAGAQKEVDFRRSQKPPAPRRAEDEGR